MFNLTINTNHECYHDDNELPNGDISIAISGNALAQDLRRVADLLDNRRITFYEQKELLSVDGNKTIKYTITD